MRQKTEQEVQMMRYLLGELSEEENIRIEQQFFADNRYFEELLAVEDALIDDYVRGFLSQDEYDRVGKMLSTSPQQLQQVEFSRHLIDFISKGSRGGATSLLSVRRAPSRWWRLPELIAGRGLQVSLAALIIAVAAGLVMLLWNLKLHNRLERIEANQESLELRGRELQQQVEAQKDNNESLLAELEDERNRRERAEQELAESQHSRPGTSPAAILLLAHDVFLKGGGRSETVNIRPGTQRLRIGISLDSRDDYKSYNVIIKTVEGREVWNGNSIRARKGDALRINLSLPAPLFAEDDYVLTLKGQKENGDFVDIHDFPFRVRR